MSELARKALHATAPIFSVFFLIPLEHRIKLAAYLVLLSLLWVFELARIRLGFRIQGLRDYESGRPAAYAQFSLALAIIYAFGDLRTSLISLTLLALVDPVASWSRGSRLYPVLPYLAGVGPTAVLSVYCGLPWAPLVSLFVPALAVAVEALPSTVVDDDFLIPALSFLAAQGLCQQ